MGEHGHVSCVIPQNCRLVMAHGAGSDSGFLSQAFTAGDMGVTDTRFVDDRTGLITAVMNGLAAAATPDRPTVLGGVSLGAHAAARLLARHDRPQHIVAGVLVMPAWTSGPDRLADLTSAAADALAALGPEGVLAELDPHDWVTPLLRTAWSRRQPSALVAELRTAALQPGPTRQELGAIEIPVVILALRDDPLHPIQVARSWQQWIPRAHIVELDRGAPDGDLAVFGRRAAEALANPS